MKIPSKTLGIFGGGQLGRMSAIAAARLGIKVHIYCPEKDSPAGEIAAKTFTGAYDNKRKLKSFAESVDVISYEFENIPVETVRYVSQFKPVYPNEDLLEIAQDRISEKSFLNKIGIPTTRWMTVRSSADIIEAISEMGLRRVILKTTRLGYDGKGQLVHKKSDDPKKSWKTLGSRELIAEEPVDFDREVSVIVARDINKKTAVYGPILNDHKNHILSKSTVPVSMPDKLAREARDMTLLLARKTGLIGVLALEMFVTKDGRILANEIAPRTHNSGHLTIDAYAVSQFEQHVRTVCGLPVGSADLHSHAVMHNLLGSDVEKMTKWYRMKNACIHLYGKAEVKEGRKMGHVTVLKPSK